MDSTAPHLPNSVAEEDIDLIRRAQKADQADHALTIREALRKYPRAVCWSLLLSMALVVSPGVPPIVNLTQADNRWTATASLS